MGTLSSYAIPLDSRVQVDGKAVTSQDLRTTMEYALALVEQFFGKEKAHELSGLLVCF
ncbi:putative class I glutamine amidotransferase [Helianthus annuus]|uniref:Class I glutamine amidotransferase n=1 Tax=Helianthus annuus TaxID=4232 RepID=A0A9K3DY88_HELAN|nr:putative class I glutamine amidotransferase [Helianthus annuus]KAJ0454360.1 putative class I glutamine amidotransferase [Helianthus annuus]KAJ0472116.1 putative class I glutamine amidotransferase [Helianthus annuus]KAJ0830202.1 putative class I glutamine amidotransferase [Helianthus annuus]